MPQLAEYRRELAVESGPYIGPESYFVRATSGSSTTKLVCSQYPIFSNIPQDDTLVDRPLYRPNAVEPLDKHRYVSSYEPSTGTINPDHDWITAPFTLPGGGNTYGFLEAFTYQDLEGFYPNVNLYEDLEGLGESGIGERFEILGPFDVPTMHKLINDGLKQCWITVEVAATAVEGATRHDLNQIAPWLMNANQVLQVGLLAEGVDRNVTDPFNVRVYGEVERDGGGFYLNTRGRSFNVGDTLFFRCLKRAYDHCRMAGGEYGEQSGLSLETDEAPVSREWLVASALTIAWRRYAKLLEVNANQRLIRDQVSAAMWFSDQCHKNLGAVKPQMTYTPPRRFGPAFV